MGTLLPWLHLLPWLRCCMDTSVAMVTGNRCRGYHLEREESVKADIFQAYRTLLQVTKSSVRVSDQDSMETGDR